MAQRNQAGRLPTCGTEESERQRETSGDNDPNLTAEDDIHDAQNKNSTTPAATIQPATAENSAHLERTLQHSHDETRSTSQGGGPGTNGESWPERTSSQVSASIESPSHSNENAAGEDQKLSQLGAMVLDEIREKLLFELDGGTESDPGPDLLFFYPLNFSIMVEHGTRVDIAWSPESRALLPDKMADAIRRGWPQNRNSEGMEQCLLESNGTTPVTEVSWRSAGEDFQQRYDLLSQQMYKEKEKGQVKFLAYERLWHKWCLAAAENKWRDQDRSSPDHADISSRPSKFRVQMIYCELENYKKEQHMFPLDQVASVLSYDEPFLLPPFKEPLSDTYYKEFNMASLLLFLRRDFQVGFSYDFSPFEQTRIQFQLRYFRPIGEILAEKKRIRYPCFLGDRQRAIIGQGSEKQHLEEKRARVTLRASSHFPGLFNILVLADECVSPKITDWTPITEDGYTEPNWARYGLKPCGKGIAITHYLFEVSRVLERSLDTWSTALDSIDELVHVDLSDFEDKKRVEDLMFDKSFTRSKDYFVAIQLIRIMDEWLDEVLLGIEDLRETLTNRHTIIWADEAQDNVNIAVKGMKEHAAKLQNRARKRSEEIKSLRDGLFNATSLREATKAMALNQAIYVFTVVTVLFTPVSFLATFWALPFLNNPAEEGSDMVPEPASFRSSFIAMPLLTYALVIGIAWYMRPDQGRYRLSDWLTGIWDATQKALRTAWDSFLHEKKRTRRKTQGGSDAGDSA